MRAEVVLLAGYKRTGKDTLYKQLRAYPGETVAAWSVYCHAEAIKAFPTLINVKRLAFADALKEEVAEHYHMSVPDDMKDERVFDCLDVQHKSARDLYTEWAKIRRASDPEYWAKLLGSQIKRNGKYVVTDWRFPNEYTYLDERVTKLVTARVFRSHVPIPAASEESEHALDTWATQYLIVPESLHDEDFRKAVEVFPFYKDYVQCDTL